MNLFGGLLAVMTFKIMLKSATYAISKGYTTLKDLRVPTMECLTYERIMGQQGFHEKQELTTKYYEMYFIEELLSKEITNGESKIYIAKDQIMHLFKRVHDHNGSHLNLENSMEQILKGPYWWPTIAYETNHYITSERPKFDDKIMTGAQCGAITITELQEDWRTPFIELSHTWEIDKTNNDKKSTIPTQ